MKIFYQAGNWLFGILFLIIGLSWFVQDLLVPFPLIAISCFLLPPVRQYVFAKTNKAIPIKVRTLTVFVLFIAFSLLSQQAETRIAREESAQLAQDNAIEQARVQQGNIEYYRTNRDAINANVKSAIDGMHFDEALRLAKTYLASNDDVLVLLNQQAQKGAAELITAKRTQLLRAELARIPATAFKDNQTRYQQLVSLHPGNEEYARKLKHYSAKVADKEEKNQIALARKLVIQKQFSAWDGSHRALEKVIKNGMNDPDSYEHVVTKYWDRGDHLKIKTTFRGNNAFGGKVKNFVTAKVSLNGQILSIIDQS
jgi:hypothetical protein